MLEVTVRWRPDLAQGGDEQPFQGQRWGRCRVWRRAERVRRPGTENKHSRSREVVVSSGNWPVRPMSSTQRARLWAMVEKASQAALAANRPPRADGPDPTLL